MNEPTIGQCIAYEFVRSMTTCELTRKMKQMEFCEVFHCYTNETWRDAYQEIYRLCKNELDRREQNPLKVEWLEEDDPFEVRPEF